MTLSSGILDDIDTVIEDWDTAVYNGGTIYGIFGKEYAEVLGAESGQPMFDCKTSDVSGIAQDATLVITSELHGVSAVSYTVVNVQENAVEVGPGMTRLILRVT